MSTSLAYSRSSFRVLSFIAALVAPGCSSGALVGIESFDAGSSKSIVGDSASNISTNVSSGSDGGSTNVVVATNAPSGNGSNSAGSVGSASGNAPNADGGACQILAVNYDQSCTADSDCTQVTSRDYCVSGCNCGGSAISVSALAQFNQDVAQTPSGSGALPAVECPCAPSLVCCRNSLCSTYCP